VQEYLVWLTQEQAFRWYVLQAGDYVQPPPDQLGILHSRVFPGLQLAVEALLRGEMPQVLAVLPAGIASEVHRSFVQKLG
jgi:Uma2 family endonuclease